MASARIARAWHGLTAVTAAFGLTVQLILVTTGASVLAPGNPPSRPERLFHFFSYFTVLTNLLVCLVSATLARDPARDGLVWRVARLSALAGITMTGVVHWFLLRMLVDLQGWSLAMDKILHLVVPALALVGWLLFGPRPRIRGAVVVTSLLYPIAWLAYTLVVGAVSGWYPYPFLDVAELGARAVAVACVGLTVALLALSVVMWWLDRHLAPTPRVRVLARGRARAMQGGRR